MDVHVGLFNIVNEYQPCLKHDR